MKVPTIQLAWCSAGERFPLIVRADSILATSDNTSETPDEEGGNTDLWLDGQDIRGYLEQS